MKIPFEISQQLVDAGLPLPVMVADDDFIEYLLEELETDTVELDELPIYWEEWYKENKYKMKRYRYYGERRLFGRWINYGYTVQRFALGVSVDRYSFSIEFLFFWFGIEF